KVLSVTFDDGHKKEGIGRYGKGERIMSLSEWAAYVKEVFGLKYVNVYGDLETPIETVAVCPGSGKSTMKDAVAAGADVLVTGDVDHHMGIDLAAQGVCVIDAGHYGLEKIFAPYMKDFLKKEIPSIQIQVAEEKNPFYTL
ncbi:MAG: Nif3-like dinuclear metal center hexameric protein, partial [Lachnospiraceae bacterium]|nr:Nif3-like dinuclear metal center hexameric protein [Lachnospiraceae bacterium]